MGIAPRTKLESFMAKKPGARARAEFVFFNVTYEDGSQRSNRRVPAEALVDGDGQARGVIEEQDRTVAEKSGIPPLAIKTIDRAA
jgi:hypothetical protein